MGKLKIVMSGQTSQASLTGLTECIDIVSPLFGDWDLTPDLIQSGQIDICIQNGFLLVPFHHNFTPA